MEVGTTSKWGALMLLAALLCAAVAFDRFDARVRNVPTQIPDVMRSQAVAPGPPKTAFLHAGLD
jgi:hypothetical protein